MINCRLYSISPWNANKTIISLNMAKLANNGENLNKTSGGGAVRRVFHGSWNLIAAHRGDVKQKREMIVNIFTLLLHVSFFYFQREHVKKFETENCIMKNCPNF